MGLGSFLSSKKANFSRWRAEKKEENRQKESAKKSTDDYRDHTIGGSKPPSTSGADARRLSAPPPSDAEKRQAESMGLRPDQAEAYVTKRKAANETGDETPADLLSAEPDKDKFKRNLSKMQKSTFVKAVKNVRAKKGVPASGKKTSEALETAGTINDVGQNILDAGSNATNLGMARHFGLDDKGALVKPTDAAKTTTTTIDSLGAIAGAIDSVFELITFIQKVVSLFKKGFSKSGAFEAFMSFVKLGLKVSKTTIDTIGVLGSTIPVVGAVLSSCLSAVEIVVNIVDLVKAGMAKSRISERRKKFKATHATVQKDKSLRFYELKKKKEDRKKVDKELGKLQGSADDHDEAMEYEIGGAMKHTLSNRQWAQGIDLSINALKLVGNIVGLLPGWGTLVSLSANMTASIAALGVKGGRKLKKYIKDKQKATDRDGNTTTHGALKAKNRGRYAAFLFDKMYSLSEHDISAVDIDTQGGIDILTRYENEKSFFSDMGLPMYEVATADSEPKIIEVLTNAFSSNG